jgi:hypothetical protein
VREELFAAKIGTEIEIAKKLQPANEMLSGWTWFEWGLQRALAIADGRENYSIAWASLRSNELEALNASRNERVAQPKEAGAQ